MWALVLFTAVNFLVAYEEKAPIMLYDWKIPLFLSNILFLVCLFVEQSMRSALIKKKKKKTEAKFGYFYTAGVNKLLTNLPQDVVIMTLFIQK